MTKPTDWVSRTPQKISKTDYNRIWEKGVISSENHHLANDWYLVLVEGGDSKYGREMYSPSLDRFRGLTIQEFYGGGIVD